MRLEFLASSNEERQSGSRKLNQLSQFVAQHGGGITAAVLTKWTLLTLVSCMRCQASLSAANMSAANAFASLPWFFKLIPPMPPPAQLTSSVRKPSVCSIALMAAFIESLSVTSMRIGASFCYRID